MATVKDDQTNRTILTAAAGSLRSVGLARTTMEHVANAAGIGVATVYRRFSKKENLIEQALRFEAKQMFERVRAQTDSSGSYEEELATAFWAFVQEVRSNPLIHGVGEGNVLAGLPLISRTGSIIVAEATDFAVSFITARQATGELPAVDPRPAAEIFARIGHSIILAPEGSIPIDDEASGKDFARRYLAPIVTGRRG